MKCKHCGYKNPPGGNFCINCGEPLEQSIVCRSCGNEVPEGSKFCTYCGERIVTLTKRSGNNSKHIQYKNLAGKDNKTKRKKKSTSKNRVVIAVLVAIIFLIAGFGSFKIINRGTTRVVTDTSSSRFQASKEVDRIAANFFCPCGGCDLRLDECHCDKPKGAVEIKGLIKSLIKEGFSDEEIIKRIDKKYKNKIV